MGSSQYLSFRIIENAYLQGGLLYFNQKLNSTKSHGRNDEELPSDLDTTQIGHQRNNYDLLLCIAFCIASMYTTINTISTEQINLSHLL